MNLVQLILNKEQIQNNLQAKHLIIQSELSKPRVKWDIFFAISPPPWRRHHAIRYQSSSSWNVYVYFKPFGPFVFFKCSLFCCCFVGRYQMFAVKSDRRGDRHKDRAGITARIACLKFR